MRCPRCGHLEDKVLDSRTSRSGDLIRRRRACLACNRRFTTREEVVRARLNVIKRDGRREAFDRDKLINGIQRACEKRPVSAEQIETFVDALVAEIENDYELEVPSEKIGEKVMAHLETLDEVAYVRFASVYRRFKDVNQFINAIRGLVSRE